MEPPIAGRVRVDVLTLIAVAIVAYTLTNFLHEGLGHGGMCALQGGTAATISTMHCECEGELSTAASKAVTASGSVVNLLVGLGLLVGLRSRRGLPGWGRYFLWLMTVLNLLIAGGYLLAFSFFRIGDWGKFPTGLPFEWGIRVLQFVLGFGISFLALRAGWHALFQFLPGGDDARAVAKRLCRIPFWTGGTFAVLSGLNNPLAGKLLLLSAVAATFGGSFWLWGMPAWNRDLPPADSPGVRLDRSVAWIVAAVLIAAARVIWLGPGLRVPL